MTATSAILANRKRGWIDSDTGERVTALFVIAELQRDGLLYRSAVARVRARRDSLAAYRLYQYVEHGEGGK